MELADWMMKLHNASFKCTFKFPLYIRVSVACAVPAGFELSGAELADWMMKLQDFGNCHNINFVTPEHVAPQVRSMS